MKILQVYNEQRSRLGGEPAVIEVVTSVLEHHGHVTEVWKKSSRDLENALLKQLRVFWSGSFDPLAQREMSDRLASERPDLVHVHSVYPMFSPSILVACRKAGVPVVVTVHTHNLTCPTWFHLRNGLLCTECIGGHEQRCVTNNCRDNLLESTAYAMRNAVARKFRLFHDNVDVMIAPTLFTKELLIKAGYDADQLMVVPNPTAVDLTTTPERHQGSYIAFAGRVSPEKGVAVLLKAAALMPSVSFRIAGDGPALAGLKAEAPPNVMFMGNLDYPTLQNFYKEARILAVPSIWFEPFGMVAADAMALSLPVVASRIGGLPYVVDDGVTGFLAEPGNADDWAQKLSLLWNDEGLCSTMGIAGRKRAIAEFSKDVFYKNLMSAYEAAILKKRAASLLPVLQ